MPDLSSISCQGFLFLIVNQRQSRSSSWLRQQATGDVSHSATTQNKGKSLLFMCYWPEQVVCPLLTSKSDREMCLPWDWGREL